MSSTYSPDLRIELIGTGDQAGVWGATTNNNLAYVIEQAVAGYVSVSVISANQALTYLNGASAIAADNQAVHSALALTTTTGANFAVYAPPASKQFTIYNASAYTATVYNSSVIGNTTAAGTGVAIPTGKTMTVWSDGTNFTQQNTHLISPTVANPTLTAPVLGTPASGTMTNVTGLPVSTGISGLGTGVATFLATPSSANLAAALTDETGAGANVFATSPTLVTPVLGTPTSGNLSNCTGVSLTSGISGTLPVANGGTGVTNSTGSGNNVLSTSPTLVTPVLGTPTSATLTNATGLPIGTGVSGLGTGVATALAVNVGTAGAPVVNGGVLGTPSSGTLTNCTFPTLNQNTTGTAAGLSATLAVASGGTGTTTAQGAMNAFAGAVTSTQYLRGNGTNVVMSAIQVADVPTLNQNTTGSSGSCTGNSATATSATSATSATNVTNSGGWSVTPSGTKLYFNYNGTNVASLDSSGNFIALANITAYGTP